MEPRIEILEPKKLIGMRMKMTFARNRTVELWRQFMPRSAEVRARLTPEYISMQIFEDLDDRGFLPDTRFEKWAVVEVARQDAVPEGMEAYTLAGGKYAAFLHEGPASAAPKTFGYIFDTWLPGSEYALDHREHFEILPENYRADDPDAREEVWIPIR